MKLTSLSKSAQTIGLMFLLSALVGATVQQSVQAQNRVPTRFEKSCSAWTSEGIYSEFKGIEFTPQQKAAYQRFFDETNAKNGAIFRAVRRDNVRRDPTPEQNAEMDRNLRRLEAQTLSILTPEQQKVYQENLIVKRALEDCDPVRQAWIKKLAANPVATRPAQPKTIVDIAAANPEFSTLVTA
ncbi:hypothetical protein IQ250_27035, partial [Pseudanabaenaceae cyanobacterium LEGE 13415]|nr:hypothetical protein [Pseudanabaenaceae cyanobacterium LEGE 13415]